MAEQKLTDEELFTLVEYSPEDAEKTGYSDYSYWKSVFTTFLKNKVAVALLIVFVAVVIFSFVALAIAKFDYNMGPNTADMYQNQIQLIGLELTHLVEICGHVFGILLKHL